MSSPPTSSTSTKPAQISQQRRKFNLQSLKSLHRKPIPLPIEQTEQYEVAPGTGILNTDATAIVFGYIDREERQKKEEKKKSRKSKHSDLAKRNRGRSRSPVKKAYERFKEVHTDDGTDDFRKSTHRQHVEASVQALQEKRDDSHRIWKESQDRSKRGRMVSEDDRLHSRGANPRTGIVTPYVVSDRGSTDSGYGSDYLRARPHQGPTVNQGSWRQDEKGWSLVEDSELMSQFPIQRTKAHGFRDLDRSKIDNLLQNPEASEPIIQYQHGIRRAHQDKDGNKPWLDPNEPSSPRRWTPEGPSSPVSRLRKIPRKTVGSDMRYREKSTDTVVVNEQVRAASTPQPQQYSAQRQRVRIVTPAATTSGHSSATNTPHSHIHTSRSFLGHPPGLSPNPHQLQWAVCAKGDPGAAQKAAAQMLSSCPNPTVMSHHFQIPPRKQENLPGHVHFAVPIETPPHMPELNPSQHVPILQYSKQSPHYDQNRHYHHPSNVWHTYNAEREQTRTAMDVPITTTTTTTMSSTKPELTYPASRPRPLRQGGSHLIPQMSLRSGEQLNFYTQNLLRGTTNEGATTITTGSETPSIMYRRLNQDYQQKSEGISALRKSSLPSREALFTKSFKKSQGGPPLSIDGANTDYRGETYNGWVVPDAMTVPVHHPITPNQENHNAQTGMWAQTPTTRSTAKSDTDLRHQVVRAGSGNTDPGAGPPGQSRSQAGKTQLDEKLDADRGEGRRITACENEIRGKEGKTTAQDCGGKWYKATVKKRQRNTGDITCESNKLVHDMQRNDSLRRRVAEVKSLCSGFEFRFHPYVALKYVLRALIIMVHHVLMTLHPSSRTLAVLWGSEDPGKGGYWAAWGEVIRAMVYVLLLTGLLLAVGRMLKIVANVGRILLRPVRLIWRVGRWCLVS
ncbi:hypothetical protein MMC11_007182 [Xylographa trunciseda]|nr:hypothetical protein [Xylographa trunciseda]